jgi:hypothetical protein
MKEAGGDDETPSDKKGLDGPGEGTPGGAVAEAADEDVSADATEAEGESAADKAARKRAADDSDIEEAIRDEVLSKTKEVEQKVLDEVFGKDKDEFRNKVQAELANTGEAKPKEAKAKGPAPAAEAEEPAPSLDSPADAPVKASSIDKIKEKLSSGVTWLAFQINRPFERILNPERRQLLAILSVSFLAMSFVGLAAAFLLRWMGR